jgi:cytochrome c6
MNRNFIDKEEGTMKKTFILLSLFAFAILVSVTIGTAGGEDTNGEALFKQHCSVCHPDGGNIVNPQKTLHKKDREANGVKTASDIISKMRNPGPGMTQFDEKAIPDKYAKEIAGYILKAF